MNREEAIKIVKSYYPANKQMLNEALEFLIPELKKDENEKIRKEIITYLSTVDDKELIPYESWIDWLEKQGEAKPVEWSDEDEKGLEDALWAINQARTIAKDENDMGTLWYAEKWLNTIKEKVVG